MKHEFSYAKVILVLTVSVLLAFKSYSQSSLSFYGSYIHNLRNGFKNNTQGIGARFEWGKEAATLTKYVGLSYGFPFHLTLDLEARAFDNFTSPQTVAVTGKYSQPMVRLETGGNLYLVGDPSGLESVNWYLNGGIELLYINNKPTYLDYDKEKYTLGFSDDSDVNPDGSEKFGLNFQLAVGTCLEKNIGGGSVFLQTAISVPVYSSAQTSGDIPYFVPSPLSVNIGYKIPLNKR